MYLSDIVISISLFLSTVFLRERRCICEAANVVAAADEAAGER